MVQKLDSFLWKFPLRTGTLSISVIILLISLLNVAFFVSHFIHVYNDGEEIFQDETPERAQRFRKEFLFYNGLSAAMAFSVLLLDVLLFIGAYKKKYRLMTPGITVAGCALCLGILMVFSEAWHSGIRHWVFKEMCYAVVSYYAFSVMFNYYCQLKVSGNMPKTLPIRIVTDNEHSEDLPIKKDFNSSIQNV